MGFFGVIKARYSGFVASIPSNRTRGQRLKLQKGRFRLDMGRNFFTEKAVKHWNGLPREVAELPSLEMLKKQLDGEHSAVVWLARWRSVKGGIWSHWSSLISVILWLSVTMMVGMKQFKSPFLPERMSCCCASQLCVVWADAQRTVASRMCLGYRNLAISLLVGNSCRLLSQKKVLSDTGICLCHYSLYILYSFLLYSLFIVEFSSSIWWREGKKGWILYQDITTLEI